MSPAWRATGLKSTLPAGSAANRRSKRGLSVDDEVTLGIPSPECLLLSLTCSPNEPEDLSFTAKSALLERLGSEALAHVQACAARAMILWSPNSPVTSRSPRLRAITLHAQPNSCHLFDSTGQRRRHPTVIYRSRTSGLLYLSPYLVGLAVFTLFPFVASLLLSFSDYRLQDSLGAAHLIGLENYRAIAHDRTFAKSLIVTLVYVFVTVPLKLAFALFIAFVLNFRLRGIDFSARLTICRRSSAAASPSRCCGALCSRATAFSTRPSTPSGRSHQLAGRTHLRDGHHHPAAPVAVRLGHGDLPRRPAERSQDLYEAARLDGANPWQQFWRITLPLLTPVIFFNFIMQMVQAFQEFNGPYVITEGGPLNIHLPAAADDLRASLQLLRRRLREALSWCLFIARRASHRDGVLDLAALGVLRAGARRRTKSERTPNASLRYGVLIGVGLLMLYPLLWMVGGAFKPNHEIFTSIGFIPQHRLSEASRRAGRPAPSTRFATYLLNSFAIVIPRSIVTVVSSVLVAFGFARFDVPGKRRLFGLLIATMLLPLIVLLVPQYLMFREFGWLDTFRPLFVPSAFATDAFFVFMIVQFLRSFPSEMEEAAVIDGCNSLQVLWHVVVPVIHARDRLGGAVPVHVDHERFPRPADLPLAAWRIIRCRWR